MRYWLDLFFEVMVSRLKLNRRLKVEVAEGGSLGRDGSAWLVGGVLRVGGGERTCESGETTRFSASLALFETSRSISLPFAAQINKSYKRSRIKSSKYYPIAC